MMVERTLDVGIPLAICNDLTVFNEITEDNAKPLTDFDVINDIYLAVGDDELKGLIILESRLTYLYDIHVRILPKHRKQVREITKAGWDWIEKHLPNSVIQSYAPDCCDGAKWLLNERGFTKSGCIPKAWRKNGQMYDIHTYYKEVQPCQHGEQ